MQHLDFETRSELELDEVGVWAYAAHPSTDVLCLGFSTAAGPKLLTAKELAAGPTGSALARICYKVIPISCIENYAFHN